MVTREEGGSAVRVRVMDFGLARAATESRLTQDGHARRHRRLPLPRAGRLARASTAAPTSTRWASSSTSASWASRPSPARCSRSSTGSSTRSRSRRARSGAEIREELQDILLRCLEKDPGKRPQKAGQVAEALRRHRASLASDEFRMSVVLYAEPRHPAPGDLRLRRPREGVRRAPAPPERGDRGRGPVRGRGGRAGHRQDAPARGAQEPRHGAQDPRPLRPVRRAGPLLLLPGLLRARSRTTSAPGIRAAPSERPDFSDLARRPGRALPAALGDLGAALGRQRRTPASPPRPRRRRPRTGSRSSSSSPGR